MTLRLNGSSSGFTEVKAPAAAGSNTITLPTSNGSAEQFLKNSGTAGELEYSSMVETSTGVGIGETSPLGKCHIKSGDSGASSVGASADELVIEGSANCGITILSGTTSQGLINFADSGDVNVGNITYDHTSNFLSIKTNDDERIRLDSLGSLNVGCTSNPLPSNGAGRFHVDIPSGQDGLNIKSSHTGNIINIWRANTGGSAAISFYHNAAPNQSGLRGSITTSSSSVSYNTTSDYRLKENVVALDGAITRVKQLLPKRFNFVNDAETTVDGFMAHEAQAVVPEAVTGTHNEVDDDNNPVYQGIDQAKLVPLLTAALQEAISKIETLETKVAALEAA